MQREPAARGRDGPPWGNLVLEALKGIRSEILLYGIVVIVIIVGSAQFGITVLQTLEIPLLVFATIVLVIYFFLALLAARRRAGAGKAGEKPGRTGPGNSPRQGAR